MSMFWFLAHLRYGKAATSKERRRSRFEDVEDFPESGADQVDAVVDYLIESQANINAEDKYGMLFVVLLGAY